jgi:hypothetical protein
MHNYLWHNKEQSGTLCSSPISPSSQATTPGFISSGRPNDYEIERSVLNDHHGELPVVLSARGRLHSHTVTKIPSIDT